MSIIKRCTLSHKVEQCLTLSFIVSTCKYRIRLYTSSIISSEYKRNAMAKTAKSLGLFLATGLILALAAIYTLPMQQATACGKSCDGGSGGGDDCCGGSLVNVEDNNVGSNIGNIDTGDIASDNKIKFLNNNNIGNLKDVNVLSKNYLKDFNVLSKNDVLSKNINNINLDDVIKDNDVIDGDAYIPVLNDNVQLGFLKLLSGCGC